MALSQIKRTAEQRAGRAAAGLILGWARVVVSRSDGILVGLFLSTDAPPDCILWTAR